ncbi:MAG: LysM domain-containing protein [Polyangiales bacterium]
MFLRTSRYYEVETATLIESDGREVRYARRRFIPRATAAALAEHTVAEGDRIDNVTARYLGDPEQFWRVCDANRAERPDDLTAAVGRVLIIPMPQAR